MNALLARLWQRLLYVVGRGRITLVDDSGPVQMVQIITGPLQTLTKAPRVVEYGLASNPPAQTDGVVVCIAGDPAKGVVVGTNHQGLRPRNLLPGEVMLYDSRGQRVYLSAAGIVVEGADLPITVNSSVSVTVTAPAVTVEASTSVTLDTPLLTVTGDIACAGTVSGAIDVTAAGTSLSTHTHSGVESGPDTSGPPT